MWPATLISVILENHTKPKKCHSHDFHQGFLLRGNSAYIYTYDTDLHEYKALQFTTF